MLLQGRGFVLATVVCLQQRHRLPGGASSLATKSPVNEVPAAALAQNTICSGVDQALTSCIRFKSFVPNLWLCFLIDGVLLKLRSCLKRREGIAIPNVALLVIHMLAQNASLHEHLFKDCQCCL
jgi:hypothetical protein